MARRRGGVRRAGVAFPAAPAFLAQVEQLARYKLARWGASNGRQREAPVTHAAIHDVAAAVDIESDAVVSTVVRRAESLNVTVFGFDAGQELTEHRADRAAVVQVIRGRLRFTADGEEIDAGPGFWLHMAPDGPHALVATEPTGMLLTLLGPWPAAAGDDLTQISSTDPRPRTASPKPRELPLTLVKRGAVQNGVTG
jgi:quercetin dioxygenase-like cupin family protein